MQNVKYYVMLLKRRNISYPSDVPYDSDRDTIMSMESNEILVATTNEKLLLKHTFENNNSNFEEKLHTEETDNNYKPPKQSHLSMTKQMDVILEEKQDLESNQILVSTTNETLLLKHTSFEDNNSNFEEKLHDEEQNGKSNPCLHEK